MKLRRNALENLLGELRERQEVQVGFIVRTAGEGVDEAALATDMRVLVRMWDKNLKNRHAAGCPGSIYQEIPLHIRVVRDFGWTPVGADRH